MSSGAWTSGEVDLDALADYTAGVLDGADAAVIADLVETDPRWRSAHTALVAADAAVVADLHAAAAVLPVMPDDVITRINEALADERDPVVVPIDAARSRRWRVAAQLTAAAAAVAAVAGGLTVANQFRAADSAGTMAEAPAAERGAAGDSAAPLPSSGLSDSAATVQLVATGRDYTEATAREVVRQAAAVAPPAPAATITAEQNASGETAGGSAKYAIQMDADLTSRTAGGALAHLATPAALAACLTAVGSAVPGTPGVVDFASYQGNPALVILLRQATSSTVVVVGPECGASGPDLIATLPV